MRSTKAKRWLSGTLAALMLAQGMCLPVGAEAWWNSWFSGPSQTIQVETQDTKAADVQLQNGTAIIPVNADEATVKQALYEALVVNKNEVTAEELDWEFYGTSSSEPWSLWDESQWVSVLNGKSWTSKHLAITYSYNVKPLAQLGEGDYDVRIAGTENKVSLHRVYKGTSSITLNEGCTVALPYKDATMVDYDALRQRIFNAVVQSTTPEMNLDDVTITYEAKSQSTGWLTNWVKLEGDTVDSVTYPAISEGSQKIRISYAGTETISGTSAETTVTIADTRKTPNIKLTPDCKVGLQNGNWEAVRQAILDTVVAENDYGLTTTNTTIEYYNPGLTMGNIHLGADWVLLEGEPFSPGINYPAVQDGQTYKVRVIFNGSADYKSATSEGVNVLFASKEYSNIAKNDGSYSANLSYNEDLSVNYNALREAIFDAVVDTASSTPSSLAWNDVTIEYWAKPVIIGIGSNVGEKFMPLQGDPGIANLYYYPAISKGEQKIKISWGGNNDYYGTSIEVNVNIAERPTANIQVNENPTVQLTVDENLNLNVNKLYQDMFNAIVQTSDPVLTLDDVTIEYYATATTGAVGELGKAWMPLEGGKDTLTYPAIPAGSQQVRISWPGNQQYAPTTITVNVQVKDREQVQFNLNEGPYTVGMVFNDEQGYDYTATAKAIYDAVVESTENPAGLTAEQVKVEYNADPTGLTDSFKPLDWTGSTGVLKFGTGDWEIRISWAGNQQYRGNSVTVKVTTTDNRIASSVVLKSGASFTYNMDANAMKQAIFDNVIDWENSDLPAKETLSLNNFVIEYYGENVLGGNINGGVKQWAPIEGGTVTLLTYPQMGAGENQQIRISFKGNADYRPCDPTEGTVTVNKAKVSVKVNSTNIYADEQLPADFITTDPADKFDIYTIYAGITSNVTTGVYLDLPDRYTNNAFLEIIDGALELAGKKTLTQMMQDGVTVGELREIFSTEGLLDALDKLNIDTGTFGQILTVINKLPGIMDSVRIGFGTPNRAGLYTVTAVTDNKNYETGVGFGFLLSKMRFSGPKLTWNQEISGGKLTAEQAKTFDFGATLSYNGDVTVSQEGVHYLYSGFTSKWRVYSSTTTPPTEPGRYVVTVCILGGNYMAAPITRSFQITK